jgi:hypothetical protein
MYLVLFAGLNAGCGNSSTTPNVHPKAPPDRPIQARGQAAVDEYRAAIAPYVEKARKSYPEAKKRYLEGLPPGCTFYAVTRIQDKSGPSEQVFVAVATIRDGRISGRIASEIMGVPGFQKGDPYSFSEDELLDWLISHPDGSEEGNVVGKFVDEWQKTRRRR